MDGEAMRPRWFGVGRSDSSDAVEAGAAACGAALRGPDPKLLIVFASDSYDLPALVRSVGDSAPGVPLVGCSTAGEIATTGPGDASVVVTALGGDGFAVATAVSDLTAGGLREASAAAATCMEDVEPRAHRILLLLSDGLAGDQTEVVRGAYSTVGASVPLVGGCAGDDLKMERTHQFHGDRVLRGAVVAAAVASDAPMGVGVRHGWRKVGDPMLVTRSHGNVVLELDDEPALDVYLKRNAAPAGIEDDPRAFAAFAATHPLGLDRRSGEEVRFVAEADVAARSIVCIAAVPQGGLAWLMDGDDGSVLRATEEACHDALVPLGGRPPLGLLAFDCIARKGVLGEPGVQREVDRIGGFAAGAPVAGFYTYGEFARTHGVTGFHNQTLVVLSLS